MLLSKTIKDDDINATYNSSDIKKTIYNPKEGKLIIIFKKGNMYIYENVSNFLYEGFERAQSQGVYFATHIKNNPAVKFVKLTKLKDFELKNL